MTGLYNMIFGDGQEEFRGSLLGLNLLGLEREAFGRFRDCWIEKDENGEVRLAFYTRNGGGNRPQYEEISLLLSAHPEFLFDRDDEFDETYRTYYFRVPTEPPPYHELAGVEGWDVDKYRTIRTQIEGMAFPEPVNMSDKWKAMGKGEGEEKPPEDVVDLSQEIMNFLKGSDGG